MCCASNAASSRASSCESSCTRHSRRAFGTDAKPRQQRTVVLVSSELPELIGMSDRIVMMRGGRVAGEFTRAEATQERLIAAALGHVEAA